MTRGDVDKARRSLWGRFFLRADLATRIGVGLIAVGLVIHGVVLATS